jgi:hypothetical protein
LGGSQFEASLGKNLLRPHLNGKKLEVVARACHHIYGRKYKIRITVQSGLGKKQDPISKITRAKRAGGMAQEVENPT